MIFPLVHPISYQDPIDIFQQLAGENGVVFLDSVDQREGCGDYSYIALDPFALLSSKNEMITWDGEVFQGNPFAILQEQINHYSSQSLPNLPPFQGGVAGYFAYDLYQHLEDLPLHQLDDMQFPDMMLGFYDLVIAFDHRHQKAWIFSSGYPFTENTERFTRATARMKWLLEMMSNDVIYPSQSNKKMDKNAIIADVSEKQYQVAVRKVVEYILAGDIFEANISQRFQLNLPDDFSLTNLYKDLRQINPAPFSAYLRFDDVVLLSASPERFLKVVEGDVETRPIKGTRPRGSTFEEDKKLADELCQSEKDHAENVMIVDLLRNDLSKVCQSHSVKVPQLCGLESYATVHHLVSIVTGKLKPVISSLELFQACFPGGSITGAPKIRAMEIIAEIEPTARGPYCGSIGYMSFNGSMDTSIVIRSFAVKNKKLTFQAGGAIVADSDETQEYDESLVKARALRQILVDQL